MSHIKAGDYWSATNEAEDSWWLFLIVAHATANRRRYVLAVECDWETRAPMISGDLVSRAWWFLDPDGGCTNKEVEFFLAEKQRGHGRRYLRPPNAADKRLPKAVRLIGGLGSTAGEPRCTE